MGEGVIQDDIAVAERALAEYDLAPDSALSLLNLSENATYAVEDAGTGTRSILRVHRQNYHLAHEIESELDWLDALRCDSDLTVPNVLPASDGRRVVTVNVDGTPRYVVHFEMVAGVEPDEASLTVEDFHTLGWITAVLHEHSHAWTRPSGFSNSPGTGSTASATSRAGAAGRTPTASAGRKMTCWTGLRDYYSSA